MPPARAHSGLLQQTATRAWKKIQPSVPFGSRPTKRPKLKKVPTIFDRQAAARSVAPLPVNWDIPPVTVNARYQPTGDLHVLGTPLGNLPNGEQITDISITANGRVLHIGDRMPPGSGSAVPQTYSVTCNTCSTDDTGGQIWRVWASNNATMSSATGSVTLNDSLLVREERTWDGWNNNATTSTTTGGTATYTAANWPGWAREGGVYARRSQIQLVRDERDVVAEARYREEQAARNTAFQARQAEEKVKRDTAKTRAEILLKSCLSDAQVRSLEDHGWFLIHGESGRRYRIHKGTAGNVVVLKDDGTSDHRLCFHPSMSVPEADAMLAQKLMLESCEKEALKMANRNGLRAVDHTLDQRRTA